MEQNTVKMEVLIVLLISISAILIAIFFSPDFIAGNFSSDGNLHPTTIIKINNMRIGVSIIGFLGVLSSLVLLLNKGTLYNSVASSLDSLFAKIAKIFDRVNASFYPAMILLLLAVFAGYIFIASQSFFTNDDYREVMRAMFEQFRFPLPASGQPHYRPIPREIFFFISYQLFGLKPFGYFFLNIVTHTASGVCLFFILRKLELTSKLSLLVTFIYFANLPALVKMSWISNIGHTSYHIFLAFSALFALSSVETSGTKKAGFIFLSIISWMLSLLSNQAGMFFLMTQILIQQTFFLWIRPLKGRMAKLK